MFTCYMAFVTRLIFILTMYNSIFFKRYLFPQYPEMARKLFAFLVTSSGGPASSHVISYSNFKAQTERLLSVLADDRQVLMYVTVSES